MLNLTTLQLIHCFPHPSAASNLSDITNMAVGQNGVITVLPFSLENAVRLPQYVHRTELEDSHWLCRFRVLLMQGVA